MSSSYPYNPAQQANQVGETSGAPLPGERQSHMQQHPYSGYLAQPYAYQAAVAPATHPPLTYDYSGNYSGRSGTPSAGLYSAGPASASQRTGGYLMPSYTAQYGGYADYQQILQQTQGQTLSPIAIGRAAGTSLTYPGASGAAGSTALSSVPVGSGEGNIAKDEKK